ncbi:MAG: hypothetical protein ACYTGG_05840 [Planctomycetota bacterium]|jgi:hypothetical protein
MAVSETYERIAWVDRFNRPTVEQLRAALEAEPRQLFDGARRRLVKIDGITESFAWHGDCWRWGIEYRTRLNDDPLALLIPDPGELQMAVPLTRPFVESLSRRQLKRSIREGLDLVREPFDTRWGVWPISNVAMVDDLLELIGHKREHLVAAGR